MSDRPLEGVADLIAALERSPEHTGAPSSTRCAPQASTGPWRT
ncbi:hypothetical protein ACF09G_24850 [Streptomyces albogriseolus]